MILLAVSASLILQETVHLSDALMGREVADRLKRAITAAAATKSIHEIIGARMKLGIAPK
jgi:hypothetical protein